ncbi:MAG: universal stress protein [Vicinamibacterales bacterium]
MPEMRVLIPLDGSPLSEVALGTLDTLSSVASLKVRLVSVVESVEGLTEVTHHEMQLRESNLLHAYLKEQTAEITGKPGVISVEEHVVAGDPVDMVVDQASEFRPDLMVLATHGRSGLSRWRMGSVADTLVRSGITNTLVVGPHARMRPPVRSILAPMDGSGASEKALLKAVEFAKALGSELHLVRVVEMPVGVAEQYQSSLDDLHGYWNDYLESFREKIPAGVEVRTAVRFGSPAERLLDYVAGHEIDLVIMSSRGRGGIARTALGSVAGRMIGGPAPVLIIKAV